MHKAVSALGCNLRRTILHLRIITYPSVFLICREYVILFFIFDIWIYMAENKVLGII